MEKMLGEYSMKMSRAELPLNPKEQKIKSEVDVVDGKVREALGQLKEEHGLITREKKMANTARSDTGTAEEGTSEEFVVKINEWY